MAFPKEAPGKGWVIAVFLFIVVAFCLQLSAVFIPRWFSIDCYGISNHLDVGLWYVCTNNTDLRVPDTCFSFSNLPGWDVPGKLFLTVRHQLKRSNAAYP